MPRTLQIAAVLALGLAPAACRRSGGHHLSAPISTSGAMISDPARDIVYVTDVPAGTVVALAPGGGSPVTVIDVGQAVAGLALDHCFDRLHVAIPASFRIDTYACDGFALVARFNLFARPYAIATAGKDRLLVVSDAGLLHLDLATLSIRTLIAAVDTASLLRVDREGRNAWLAEPASDGTALTRIDLADLDAPPVTAAAGSLAGAPTALSISFDGGTIYLATEADAGVHVVDADTLAVTASLDAGSGVSACTTSSTGTRMSYTIGGGLIEGRLLEQFAPGRDLFAAEEVVSCGLLFDAVNLDVVAQGVDGSVESLPLFDVRMRVPAAVKEAHDYTLTLDGTPDAAWFLFLSLAPGYVWVDPPGTPDARLIDLSLADGFALMASGTFDAAGHAELSDTVPTGLGGPVDFVFQAVELAGRGRAAIDVGNPVVLRILSAECD